MGYNKEEYEKLITGSRLFSLNKETESVAFRKESYKMVEYLYCYLLAQNEKKYEPFGCEITEVATRCINNYDESKGEFLHYFNSAWKQEYSHLSGNQAVDERLHGVKISEGDKRALKKYLRYEASLGKDLSRRETHEAIALLMEKPLEIIIEIADLVDYHITYNEIIDSSGESTSLFDQISDGHLVEEKLLSEDRIFGILTAIESTFLSLQQRQKPIISDMMTIRVADAITELGLDISGYSFINAEILQQSLKNKLPSQRAIAEKHGKNEASISRTVKEFIKRLENIIEQKG